MARSERVRFNDDVAVLARVLGLDLEDLDEAPRRALLGDAWQRRMNAHEAALAVAVGWAEALLDEDRERARVLLDRIGLVSAHWQKEELIDASVVDPLTHRARAGLRAAPR